MSIAATACDIVVPSYPFFIAVKCVRRGRRQDGVAINSPRRKPLFLHLLMVTSEQPGFDPQRICLDGIELQLQDGWATNSEFCDGSVPLCYCETFPIAVPGRIIARCADLRGLKPRKVSGESYLYLRLEWRNRFTQIPTVMLS